MKLINIRGDKGMNKNLIIIAILAFIVVIGGSGISAFILVNSQAPIQTAEYSNSMAADVDNKKEEKLNGWKEEKGSWYFYKDNEKQKDWVKDKDSWYYLGTDGKMRIGWIKSNDKWYYMNEDGTMATNTTIDGCYLNNDGIIDETPTSAKSNNETISDNSSQSTTISPDKAIELIRENDSIYINRKQNAISSEMGYNIQLVLDYYDEDSMDSSTFNENCYGIALYAEGEEICTYLVGKQTGNVYILPHQGGFNYYQIKNNQVVKTFYMGKDWR